jgi:hypothetical protein
LGNIISSGLFVISILGGVKFSLSMPGKLYDYKNIYPDGTVNFLAKPLLIIPLPYIVFLNLSPENTILPCKFVFKAFLNILPMQFIFGI